AWLRCARAAAAAAAGVSVLQLSLPQREEGALRIGAYRDPALWEGDRAGVHLSTELLQLVQRGVQGVDRAVGHPVGRLLGLRRHHASVGALAVSDHVVGGPARWRVRVHRVEAPTEQIAVEGLGSLDISGVQLVPGKRARRIDDPGADMLARLPDA